MCYDEGTLQAYLDRELSGRKRWEIEAHIAKCGKCESLLLGLKEISQAAQSELSTLVQSLSIDKAATKDAWGRLIRDERFGMPLGKKGVLVMTNGRLRKALVPLAAVAAIAVALSFTPVRKAAADLLNIFRVQKVQTINITQQDLTEMRKASRLGGRVDIKNFGKFETTGYREPRTVSYADAKAAVDFNLTIPEQVTGYGSPEFKVQDGFTNSFTLDVKKANDLIKSFGGTQLLPTALDGKKFTAKMPTTVIATYPKEGGEPLTIAQLRSPELILPDGVNANEVRDVLLSLPILPNSVRTQLKAIKDWRYTLPIPSVDGSSKEVTVNGAGGAFITPPKDAQTDENVLLWQKNGIINAVAGRISLGDAQGIASLMK